MPTQNELVSDILMEEGILHGAQQAPNQTSPHYVLAFGFFLFVVVILFCFLQLRFHPSGNSSLFQ